MEMEQSTLTTCKEEAVIISCLLCNNYYHCDQESLENLVKDYNPVKGEIQEYIEQDMWTWNELVKVDDGLREFVVRGIREDCPEGLPPFCRHCFLEIKQLHEHHVRLKFIQDEVRRLHDKVIQEFQKAYTRKFTDIKVEEYPEELAGVIDQLDPSILAEGMDIGESGFTDCLFTNDEHSPPELNEPEVDTDTSSFSRNECSKLDKLNSIAKASRKLVTSRPASPAHHSNHTMLPCRVVLQRFESPSIPVEKPAKRKRGRPKKVVTQAQMKNTLRQKELKKRRKFVLKERKRLSSRYPCKFCKKEFDCPTICRTHQNWHLLGDKKHYNCCFCTRNIRFRGFFIKHLEREHADNEQLVNGGVIHFYHCDASDCEQCFGSKVSLEEHIKSCHFSSSGFWSCTECGKSFAMEENFTKHRELVHGKEEGKVNCQFCHLVFDNEAELSIHQIIHEINLPTQKFACHVCGSLFDTQKRLSMHIRKQHVLQAVEEFTINEKVVKRQKRGKFSVYPCNECGKVFSKHSVLRSHSYEHMPDHPGFPCPTCNTVLKTPTQLSRHQINVHRRPKCEFCQKEIWSISVLREHQFLDHREEYMADKPFYCNICFRNYATECELETHVVVHENCKCKICNMQCTNARGLKIHERAHYIDRYKIAETTLNPTDKSMTEGTASEGQGEGIALSQIQNQCITCGQTFETEGTLKKHYLEIHQVEVVGNGSDITYL